MAHFSISACKCKSHQCNLLSRKISQKSRDMQASLYSTRYAVSCPGAWLAGAVLDSLVRLVRVFWSLVFSSLCLCLVLLPACFYCGGISPILYLRDLSRLSFFVFILSPSKRDVSFIVRCIVLILRVFRRVIYELFSHIFLTKNCCWC